MQTPTLEELEHGQVGCPGEHILDEASACSWTTSKCGWRSKMLGDGTARRTSRLRGTYQHHAWILTLVALNISV
jgi:hypothetical protein